MKVLLFLSLCLLASCKKDESQQSAKYCGKSCSTSLYTPVFENYLLEELASVTVRHYELDGQFAINRLISDTVYTLADTVHLYDGSGQLLGIGFRSLSFGMGQEHEIKIEATGRTYRIWNIEETEETEVYNCDDKAFTCAAKPKSHSFSGGQRRVEGNSPAYLILPR